MSPYAILAFSNELEKMGSPLRGAIESLTRSGSKAFQEDLVRAAERQAALAARQGVDASTSHTWGKKTSGQPLVPPGVARR